MGLRVAETSRCQLCDDICLAMISFIWKWLRREILDELGLYCKIPQERALLGDGEVRYHACVLHYCHSSHLCGFKNFHDELAINRGSLFLSFCGRRERVWNYICLSKWYDIQEGQSFQDMFNSMSSLVFNIIFIIKYAPEFILFCQAIGQ